MFPEETARQNIDKMLEQSGWTIQNKNAVDLSVSNGIAIREFVFSTGEADYALFINRQPVGVIEAKPEGTTVSAVFDQARKYADGQPRHFQLTQALPFIYVSTGSAIHATRIFVRAVCFRFTVLKLFWNGRKKRTLCAND